MLAEMFGSIGNDRYKEYLKDIHDSGSHLLNLINDILDLAKTEKGKIDLIESDVDVAEVAGASIRLVSERAKRTKVTITTKIADGLPQLHADERKIKQILLNLLGNAVKFTPPDGQVVVSAGLSREGDFFLQVSDTGIGIAEEHIPTVLAPFGQVDSTLSRRFQGTGLGLPLTKALVELHEGTLEVQSEIDIGATVIARFPARRLVAHDTK